MRLRVACTSLLLVGLLGAGAFAQRPASTVQLPTFSYFSVGTTVSVPDRGSVYMGGVKRAASGRNEFGVPMLPFRPFRNTAIGSERSASNVHVTAWIHDFEAMDKYLLGQAPPASRPLAPVQVRAGAAGNAFQARHPAVGNSWKPALPQQAAAAMSLAEARARREGQQQARDAEAVSFFARGQKAEAAGKTGVAKIYYQMAARRAGGELKTQITASLEAISAGQAAAHIAQSRP